MSAAPSSGEQASLGAPGNHAPATAGEGGAPPPAAAAAAAAAGFALTPVPPVLPMPPASATHATASEA